jgi:hypothetical protein
MSRVPQRLSQPGCRNLLARILDQPDLAPQIQSLPPPVLGKLIRRIGLEDAGELVALATTDQLAHVFDDDLWSNESPGDAERFDADRFLLWLEVMMEAGETFVARTLVELPEDLITLAIHRHILVLSIDELAADMQSASEQEARQLDKALESCLYEEVGEYQLMARKPEGWDTLLSAVLALDREHSNFLHRLLGRCCALASDYIEDNGGLYEVLTSDEMLECDVAADREDRRAESGFVAPTDASAFLKLAAQEASDGPKERDPVTRAWFRGLGKPPIAQRPAAARPAQADGLLRILKKESVLEETSAQRLLLPGSDHGKQSSDPLLVLAMRRVAESDPKLFGERSEELAYVANVLVSGCSLRSRRLRKIEALRAAIATCSLALALAPVERKRVKEHGGGPVGRAVATLQATPCDTLFRLAWNRLNTQVIDRAAAVAEGWLIAAAGQGLGEDKPPLTRALRALQQARARGSPWTERSSLELLVEHFDASTVDALGSLMDQVPTLPSSLAPKSGAGPHFITSAAEWMAVRRMLDSWES